jgi:hypothetical protein
MTQPFASIAELRNTLSTEILVAAGLPRTSPLQALFRPLVWPPAHRFSRIAAEFDRLVAQSGLIVAVRWVLPHFVEGVRSFGAEQIPSEGPLVIASNHPGSCDGLALASCLPRGDVKIVVTDVPFLRRLYGTAAHMLYTPPPTEPEGRMAVIREGIRHLRAGGALLIFAKGQVEPDPATLPGAEDSIWEWSPSAPLFLRRVPEAKLLVTIVSGVLAPSCLRHPLTRLRKELRYKQVLAEFIQISQQILVGRRFGLMPAVRFSQPLTLDDIGGGQDDRVALQAIVERARGLLAHLEAHDLQRRCAAI